MADLGKILIVFGVVLVVAGAVLVLAGKSGWTPWLGRLPGDIVVRRDNFTFYFPLATSLVLSVALSLLLYWLRR